MRRWRWVAPSVHLEQAVAPNHQGAGADAPLFRAAAWSTASLSTGTDSPVSRGLVHLQPLGREQRPSAAMRRLRRPGQVAGHDVAGGDALHAAVAPHAPRGAELAQAPSALARASLHHHQGHRKSGAAKAPSSSPSCRLPTAR